MVSRELNACLFCCDHKVDSYTIGMALSQMATGDRYVKVLLGPF